MSSPSEWILVVTPQKLASVRRQLKVAGFQLKETTGMENEVLIGTAPDESKPEIEAIDGVESVEPNRETRTR